MSETARPIAASGATGTTCGTTGPYRSGPQRQSHRVPEEGGQVPGRHRRRQDDMDAVGRVKRRSSNGHSSPLRGGGIGCRRVRACLRVPVGSHRHVAPGQRDRAAADAGDVRRGRLGQRGDRERCRSPRRFRYRRASALSARAPPRSETHRVPDPARQRPVPVRHEQLGDHATTPTKASRAGAAIPTRASKSLWSRLQTHRYFLTFARTTPMPRTFVMWTTLDGQKPAYEALGTTKQGTAARFGRVPDDFMQAFARESKRADETMMRIELSEAEYRRTHQVFEAWNAVLSRDVLAKRRSREANTGIARRRASERQSMRPEDSHC